MRARNGARHFSCVLQLFACRSFLGRKSFFWFGASYGSLGSTPFGWSDAMTAESPGPGPNIFSILSADNDGMYRARRETFVWSLLGQAAALGLLIYLSSFVIVGTPPGIAKTIKDLHELPLIFSGRNGGGGGDGDPLPASRGNLPPASLDAQLTIPTVILPKEPPKLMVPETVVIAPDIVLAQGGQIGDPTSVFSKVLSNGSGREGIGPGCCGGVGPSTGPGAGTGSNGNFSGGARGDGARGDF